MVDVLVLQLGPLLAAQDAEQGVLAASVAGGRLTVATHKLPKSPAFGVEHGRLGDAQFGRGRGISRERQAADDQVFHEPGVDQPPAERPVADLAQRPRNASAQRRTIRGASVCPHRGDISGVSRAALTSNDARSGESSRV
jgi:hypothetical protein